MLVRTRLKTNITLMGSLSALALASACSAGAEAAAPEFDGESAEELGQASAALTAQEAIFGFEAPLSWTASTGALGTSTVRTQGNNSLSLSNVGFSELRSPALSTLSGVSGELVIDVRPPASASWGQLQILASSPTLGWSNTWLGQVSLAGLPANQFTQLKVAIPANIQQSLKQAYSDLRIQLAINVPWTSNAWLIDNLRFSGSAPVDCGAGSPYTLILTDEEGVDPAHLERLRCTFFATYPLLVQRFNPAATTTMEFVFVPTARYPAWADNGKVYFNEAHLAARPTDSDVVVHETMHIVQAGYTGNVEGWIIEGTADFVRDAYGLTNAENNWSIPTGYAYGQHYWNGYGDAAAFFKWIDARYRQGKTPVVDELDDIMRAGNYSDATWVTLTTRDLNSLWQEYSNNQAPRSASSGVTVYRDWNYGGGSFTLARGVYDEIDLKARGMNDAVSSLRVPAGFRVTAYEDAGRTGAMTQFTADTAYVGDTWNDKFTTLVIE